MKSLEKVRNEDANNNQNTFKETQRKSSPITKSLNLMRIAFRFYSQGNCPLKIKHFQIKLCKNPLQQILSLKVNVLRKLSLINMYQKSIINKILQKLKTNN
eukprot:403344276